MNKLIITKKIRKIPKKRKHNLYSDWMLYTMVVPGVIFLILFKYIPLMGSVIAFQDYNIYKGIMESNWVGFKHFITIFTYYDIWRVILNTFRIGFELVLFTFPVPIILAILINEISSKIVKRSVQTLFYLPHFFSWVLIASLVFKFLSMGGPFNNIRVMLGLDKILLLNDSSYFDFILIVSDVWKNAGWGTIVYLASIASISPSLYESAAIDGANRLQRIKYITLPSLVPAIVILLLLRLGRFLDIGFDFIYQFLTPINIDNGDIIATYNYRAGIIDGKFSLSSALGICSAIVGLVFILLFNHIAKKNTENGGLF
ncbi:MAG: ABC transporter permease subunit [Spirochaetaceae bacterium]